jgi:hypothetical protein
MRRKGFLREGDGVLTKVILGGEQKTVKRMAGALLLLTAGLFLFSACAGGGGGSGNEVSLSVEGDQPSPIRFEGQATPVLLPHTNLYVFLTSSRPLYFRDGKYFQYYRDNWYRSEDLKGPWEQIDGTQIPDLLQNIPPDYYYDNFPYKLKKDH